MGLRVAGIQLFRQLQSLQPADSRGYVYPEMEFKIIPSETVHEIESDQEHSFSILIPGQCDVEFTVRVSQQSGGMEFKLGRCILDDSLTAADWKVYGPALEARFDPKELSIRARGYPISSRPRQSGKTLEMQKQLDELGYVTLEVGGFDKPEHGRGYYSLDHISKAELLAGKLHHEVSHPMIDSHGLPIRADLTPVWGRHYTSRRSAPEVYDADRLKDFIEPIFGLDGPEHLSDPLAFLVSIGMENLRQLPPHYQRRVFPHEMGTTFQMLPMTDRHLGDNPDKSLDELLEGFQAVALDIENGMLDSELYVSHFSRDGLVQDFIGDSLVLRKQAKLRGADEMFRTRFRGSSPLSISSGFNFPRNPNPTVLDKNGNGKKRHEPFKRDRFGQHGGPKGRKGRSKK